jgi:hypothetical protein
VDEYLVDIQPLRIDWALYSVLGIAHKSKSCKRPTALPEILFVAGSFFPPDTHHLATVSAWERESLIESAQKLSRLGGRWYVVISGTPFLT